MGFEAKKTARIRKKKRRELSVTAMTFMAELNFSSDVQEPTGAAKEHWLVNSLHFTKKKTKKEMLKGLTLEYGIAKNFAKRSDPARIRSSCQL